MSRTFGDFSNLLAKCGKFGIHVLRDRIKVKAEKFSAKKEKNIHTNRKFVGGVFFSTEAVEEAV